MIIFKHALKRSFALPLNNIITFITPLVLIFIPDQFGLTLYGIANLYSAYLLCRPIMEDRINKTIIRIASTPTSYRTYLGSHLLAYLLILTMQNILFILVNILIFGGNILDYLILFSLYFVYSIMTISFSLFWNSLFKNYNISFGLFSGVASVMCLISGVSIPYQIFPSELQKVIMILPTHWLPYGLNALNHDKIINIITSHLVLLLFSGIFFLIGSKRRY